MSEQTPARAGIGAHNLKYRILSTLVLAPLVLAGVAYGDPGNPVWFLMVAVAALIGLFEWLRLVAPAQRKIMAVAAGGMLLLILATGQYVSPEMGAVMLAGLTLLLLVMSFIADRKTAPLVALGLPYLGGGGLSLLAIRNAADSGMILTFYLLAVVWGTDIGGYVVGRSIGGPKLAPRISPGKTWAGLIGGMVFAGIAGFLTIMLTDGRDPLAAGILGLVLAVVAQAGDLFKSAFKRRAGVKDSGQLIPGHGGVLDRIDGLVVAALVFALLRHSCAACTSWW